MFQFASKEALHLANSTEEQHPLVTVQRKISVGISFHLASNMNILTFFLPHIK